MSLLQLLTPWDTRALGRSMLITTASVVLAIGVTAATDEGGVSWGERVARVLPLVPLCGAFATGLTLSGRDRRGEGVALEALGRSSFANGAAAAGGAAAVGAAVALVLLVDPRVAVDAFFPSVHAQGGGFVHDELGFTSLRAGFRVLRDGSLVLSEAASPMPVAPDDPGGSDRARACAATLTLVASLAFALAVAAARRRTWRPTVLALLTTAASTAGCLQAVAVGRMPLGIVPVPSTVLLLGSLCAIVARSWQARQAWQRTPPTPT